MVAPRTFSAMVLPLTVLALPWMRFALMSSPSTAGGAAAVVFLLAKFFRGRLHVADRRPAAPARLPVCERKLDPERAGGGLGGEGGFGYPADGAADHDGVLE